MTCENIKPEKPNPFFTKSLYPYHYFYLPIKHKVNCSLKKAIQQNALILTFKICEAEKKERDKEKRKKIETLQYFA